MFGEKFLINNLQCFLSVLTFPLSLSRSLLRTHNHYPIIEERERDNSCWMSFALNNIIRTKTVELNSKRGRENYLFLEHCQCHCDKVSAGHCPFDFDICNFYSVVAECYYIVVVDYLLSIFICRLYIWTMTLAVWVVEEADTRETFIQLQHMVCWLGAHTHTHVLHIESYRIGRRVLFARVIVMIVSCCFGCICRRRRKNMDKTCKMLVFYSKWQ